MKKHRKPQIAFELPKAVLNEIRAEAKRQCKTVSGLMRDLWFAHKKKLEEGE
jgi:hypothetical protein